MNQIVDFCGDDLIASERDVLGALGVPRGAPVSNRVAEEARSALAALRELIAPAGVVREVDAATFSDVFDGEGANASDSVVGVVFPRADALALFTATVGKRVSERIQELFATDESVRASMLDAAASLAADRTSELLAFRFREGLEQGGVDVDGPHVLGYSPGYCGWHVSGQKRLFDFLDPGRVGITLNDSFLMTPMKSVSGVLAAGPTSAHDFAARFSYCGACRDHSCAARIRGLHVLDGTRPEYRDEPPRRHL